MWWLERADLIKRGASGAHQLGTYPRTADLWLKDRLHDKETKRSYRKPLDFTLKPVRRPDVNPLRPDLRLPIEEVPPYDAENSTGFEIPSSWRDRLKATTKKDPSKYRLEKEEEVVVIEKELSAAEKEQILLEQEGFVAKKRTRWRVRDRSANLESFESKNSKEFQLVKPQIPLPNKVVIKADDVCQCETCFLSSDEYNLSCKNKLKQAWLQDILASLQSQDRPEIGGTLPGWIKRALVTKPPGRAEGLRAPVSAIGSKLNRNSTGLRLWHEQVFQGEGLQVTGILLRQTSSEAPLIADVELCKPISSFLRVVVPPEYNATERISPEEQQAAIEKGGHGAFKDAIVDRFVLLESIRRADDPSQAPQEASAVLCLGVLYDNGQDYTRAVEHYKLFSEICQRIGDVKGEAMGYNFIACSLQEEQDKKLKMDIEKVGPMGELDLSTEATMKYEEALKSHEKHAELADLEGKYLGYTNVGLLQSTLGSWIEAARSHRKALKCATYLRRPEFQSVSVGNLAFLLLRRRKLGAARLCTKRYLQICEAFQYTEGEARGHYMLGHIFTQQRKYSEAAEEFRIAMRIAKSINNTQLERSAKVLIGVSKGKQELGKQPLPGCS